jgi:hypothetical protein
MLNFFEETISLDALLFYYINSTHEPLMTNKIVCKLRHEEKTQEFAYCHSFIHTRFTPTILSKLTETESQKTKNSFGEKKTKGVFPIGHSLSGHSQHLSKKKKVRKSKKNQW